MHSDPFEYLDKIIIYDDKDDDYDNGSSSIGIECCPWYSSKL